MLLLINKCYHNKTCNRLRKNEEKMINEKEK